ncbi:MAG: hypothetical protein AAB870_05435 [Patescibacteria group bacterium]
MTFTWENKNNPDKLKFREQYDLDTIIKDGKTEFEKQLLLKSWVYATLPDGNPSKDYSQATAFEILNDAQKGFQFWCTQYTQVFIYSAIAMDFYVRKLGVDSKDPSKDMHHGVADIWSSKFKKWYVVDPQANLHYEKDSIPLNSLEIRSEYIKDGGKMIKGIIGNYEKIIEYKENSQGFHSPSNYFWFFIALRNNFFEDPNIYNHQALLWIDEFNKDMRWLRKGGHEEHPMYESQFIPTSDINKCFPDMSFPNRS